MEFIDFIFVNCLILNIKCVKIKKKIKNKNLCRLKFSNVLLVKYYTTYIDTI